MSLTASKNKIASITIIVFGVLIFSYTITRAYLLSITWDESYTYLEFIKHGIYYPKEFGVMSANNHILNSVGGIFFTKLLGISEFTLRLTTLFSHLFFLFYSAKLTLKLNNKWVSISAFLILNLNPFMLDFFSLSRGYGISLGFLMPSIYYLLEFNSEKIKIKYAVISLLFAALGTLGNLTLLNYFFVLYCIIILIFFYNNYNKNTNKINAIKKTIYQLLLPTFLFGSFLFLILPYSFELRKAGALFMGGESGLWTDTLGTIIPRLWYGLDFSYYLIRLSKGFILIVIFIALCYSILNFFKNKKSENLSSLTVMLLLFLGILFFAVLQHYLLDTLYLIERAVLFLYVIFLVVFIFLVKELMLKNNMYKVFLHLFALFVIVHFVFSINFKYVYEWKDDCETKDMLSDLEKIKKVSSEKFNLSIGIPLSLESSINFYRNTNQLNWLNQTMRSKRINYLDDYFFLRPEDFKNENADSLEIIKIYPITKNVLAKPKFIFKKTSLFIDTIANYSSFKINSEVEYSPGINIVLPDSLPKGKTALSCQVEFKTNQNLTGNVFFIMSLQEKGSLYFWKNYRLNDFIYSSKGVFIANFSANDIPAQTKSGDELKVYLWNPNKQELHLNTMQLKWISYSN